MSILDQPSSDAKTHAPAARVALFESREFYRARALGDERQRLTGDSRDHDHPNLQPPACWYRCTSTATTRSVSYLRSGRLRHRDTAEAVEIVSADRLDGHDAGSGVHSHEEAVIGPNRSTCFRSSFVPGKPILSPRECSSRTYV